MTEIDPHDLLVDGVSVRIGPSTAFLGHVDMQSVSSAYVIADEHTAEHCVPKISLPTNCRVIKIPAGESAKTLTTCEMVWSELAQYRADRSSLIINVGGGVVTDLGGFCAATYMRGIRFIHVPTSVLAMTDAAIGGKHGVDFQHLKNYVGIFAAPEMIHVDTGFLATLPRRHVANGLAEVIKHGCILDTALLDIVESSDEMNWDDLLYRSIRVKKHFVEADPKEQGLRTALNFGHTIGHALESFALMTDVDLLHGEAIALGMQVEARISGYQLGLQTSDIQRLDQIVRRVFPETRMPDIGIAELIGLIDGDKKNRAGKRHFTLLSHLGQIDVGHDVSNEMIQKALSAYFA